MSTVPEEAGSAGTERVAPVRGGSLSARAQQALLDLAEAADRAKGENQRQAITAACRRAEELTGRLERAKAVASELGALDVPPVTPRTPDSTNARRNLRALATRVSDPGVDAAELLGRSSIAEAWKLAEQTVRALDAALHEAAGSERERLRPNDLHEVTVSVPGLGAAALTTSRIRRSFDGSVKELPTAQLPEIVERWRTEADQWEQIKAAIGSAVAKLDPEVQAFVEAAATAEGAPWSLITPTVRDWLDRDGNGDVFTTRRTHAQ